MLKYKIGSETQTTTNQIIKYKITWYLKSLRKQKRNRGPLPSPLTPYLTLLPEEDSTGNENGCCVFGIFGFFHWLIMSRKNQNPEMKTCSEHILVGDMNADPYLHAKSAQVHPWTRSLKTVILTDVNKDVTLPKTPRHPHVLTFLNLNATLHGATKNSDVAAQQVIALWNSTETSSALLQPPTAPCHQRLECPAYISNHCCWISKGKCWNIQNNHQGEHY